MKKAVLPVQSLQVILAKQAVVSDKPHIEVVQNDVFIEASMNVHFSKQGIKLPSVKTTCKTTSFRAC